MQKKQYTKSAILINADDVRPAILMACIWDVAYAYGLTSAPGIYINSWATYSSIHMKPNHLILVVEGIARIGESNKNVPAIKNCRYANIVNTAYLLGRKIVKYQDL